MTQTLRPTPGAVLLHPWPVLASGLILLNALWLRQAHPGWVSGKLSDVGICFLLPVTLVASWQWIGVGLGRLGLRIARRSASRAAGAATVAAALYFAMLKVVPAVGEVHRAVVSAVAGSSMRLTHDPTDLACLVFCGLAYLYLRGPASPSTSSAPERGARGDSR